MSTNNIGLYEEISKMILKLSSNIKYTPYLFCHILKISFDVLIDGPPQGFGHRSQNLACSV